jgi:predicted CoA-binding protein
MIPNGSAAGRCGHFLEARYSGVLYPINPNRKVVQGMPAYPDVASVPVPVEFALIAIPAAFATIVLEAPIDFATVCLSAHSDQNEER